MDNSGQNAVKDSKQTDEIKENSDSTEKVENPIQESKEPKLETLGEVKATKILQPTNFKGKLMEYKLYGGGFVMKRPKGTTAMPIELSEVDTLICELQEIKKVIS